MPAEPRPSTLLRKLREIPSPRRRRRLLVVLALASIAALLEAGIVLMVDPLVRDLVDPDDGDGGALRYGALVAFGLVVVGKNLLAIGLAWWKNRELFGIQAEVSERLLDIYIDGTNPAVRDLDAGQRTSFAITEPLQLVLNCYLPVVNIAADGLAIAAVTTVLVIARPAATLILVAALTATLTAFTLLTRQRIIGYGRRRKDSDTGRQELLRAVIESRVEVSGLGVKDVVLGRYAVPNRTSAAMTAQKNFLTEASKNVIELLGLGAIGVLALLFASSDGAELLALLATFGVAAYRTLPALNRIMVSTQSLKFGVATADTIHGILAADVARPVQVARTAALDSRATRAGDLVLRFRGFRAPNGTEVVRDQEVVLRAGDICIVWGASGSGKSTLLAALVDGADGLDIHYDGWPLEHGLSELAGTVGVTAQSPLIIPGTLGENLALGLDPRSFDPSGHSSLLDTDPRSVLDAARLNDNLDRPIHRHVLSGGQAQRISLLRALAPAHRIVLLDEPTSALDRAAAAALRERLLAGRAGRIQVVVTHDADLKSLADVVLEAG